MWMEKCKRGVGSVGKEKERKDFLKILFYKVHLISILKCIEVYLIWVFPDGSDGKESACRAEDLGSILGSGRSPREGNGYPLQYSCLGNSMDRGAWWGYCPRGPKKLDTTEWLTLLLYSFWVLGCSVPLCGGCFLVSITVWFKKFYTLCFHSYVHLPASIN